MDGAPNSTMTNGRWATSSPASMVRLCWSDTRTAKEVIIGRDSPIVRYEVGSRTTSKPAPHSAWLLLRNSLTAHYQCSPRRWGAQLALIFASTDPLISTGARG